MTFLLPAEAARGDRVRENEKCAFVSTRFVEPLKQKVELILQHRLKTLAADVTLSRAVDCVAYGHVIGRDRFRHRTSGAARSEKPARDFLAGADFSKRAVFCSVDVNPQRFLRCA